MCSQKRVMSEKCWVGGRTLLFGALVKKGGWGEFCLEGFGVRRWVGKEGKGNAWEVN